MPIAKFEYIRKNNVWKLYLISGDMKWHSYEMASDTEDLEALVRAADSDRYGLFFGCFTASQPREPDEE